MPWSVEDMAELGGRHSDLEARGLLQPLLDTLVTDPVYEFYPLGRGMRGEAIVHRFYTQFFEHFVPLRHDYKMLGEWVTHDSVAQEYDIALKVDGVVETHRVLGILFAEDAPPGEKRLLGGERVYASERFVQLMTGELFDELAPLKA